MRPEVIALGVLRPILRGFLCDDATTKHGKRLAERLTSPRVLTTLEFVAAGT